MGLASRMASLAPLLIVDRTLLLSQELEPTLPVHLILPADTWPSAICRSRPLGTPLRAQGPSRPAAGGILRTNLTECFGEPAIDGEEEAGLKTASFSGQAR